MMIFKKILLLFLLGSLNTVLAQESTIFGTVVDSKSGAPISYVNVYLGGTTAGAYTDSTGNFMFTTTLSGEFNLIASFIGYGVSTISLTIEPGAKIKKDLKLQEDIEHLADIEITGSNRDWKRNYNNFLEFFVGNDDFAKEVEIINPFTLGFEQEKTGEIIAHSDNPLIVENRALGYKIIVVVQNVKFNPTTKAGVFKIYPKFEELAAPNEDYKNEWTKNRKIAFEGSQRHFFKSLYRGQLKENRFEFRPAGAFKEKSELSVDDRGFLKRHRLDTDNFKPFKLSKPVYVSHDPPMTRNPNDAYRQGMFSEIVPDFDRGIILVDQHGNLSDPNSIQVSGIWFNNRLSKLLPFEYAP